MKRAILILKFNILIFNFCFGQIQLQNHSKFDFVKLKNPIIAHRGSTFWTPEETESAYRWARNIGADYLEFDLQRTKDGVLIALHDEDLRRTSDIEQVFQSRDDQGYFMPKDFNYDELLMLDAGTWFNIDNPQRSRKGFSKQAKLHKSEHPVLSASEIVGGFTNSQPQYTRAFTGGYQFILTLDDVYFISIGYQPARDSLGNRLFKKTEDASKSCGYRYEFFYVKDSQDNFNRPGLYIETKEPAFNKGIEMELFEKLNDLQLIDRNTSSEYYLDSKINIANTDCRIVLQSFSCESIALLYKIFKQKFPLTMLLWVGDPNMPDSTLESLAANLSFASKNGVDIIGPSIAGEPNNYAELLSQEHSDLIHKSGFVIHGYSFDTVEQTKRYFSNDYKNKKAVRSDGMFTNKSDLTINILIELGIYNFKRQKVDANKVLDQLFY